MDIKELKKLMKKIGGFLVMDGDEPSFVMLSYDNYRELADDGAEVAVHIEEGSATRIDVADYSMASHNGLLVNKIEESGVSEEDKINRLNQEIALLKNEIRQREMEHLEVDSE